MSAEVEIYTTMYCPYCWRAKELLSSKEIPFKEIDVGGSADQRRQMTTRAEGGRTVPQKLLPC